MAVLTLNVAHRTHVAEDTGAIFNGGSLEVRSGPGPGADGPSTGALIALLAVPTPAFAVAGDGSVESAANWSGTAGATGVPGHYRLISPDDQEVREGDAAEAPGNGEIMLFSGLVDGQIIAGGVVTVLAGGYVLTQSPAEATLVAGLVGLGQDQQIDAGSTTPLSVLLYSSADPALQIGDEPAAFEPYDASRYNKTVLSGDATLGGTNGDELIAGTTPGIVTVEFVHVEYGVSTGPVEVELIAAAPPFTIQMENLPAQIVEGQSFGELLTRAYNADNDVVQTNPWVIYSVESGPGVIGGANDKTLIANPNSAPDTIVVRATYNDSLTVANSPLDGNVSVLAAPPPPGDSNEPGGMTVIGNHTGTVKQSAGHAFGIASFGVWNEGPGTITVVDDVTNPVGSGKSLRFKWNAGSPAVNSGAGITIANSFTGGPWAELYLRLRIFFETGGWQHSHKIFYIKPQEGTTTNTFFSREGTGSSSKLRYVGLGDVILDSAASPSSTGLKNFPLILGQWLNIELNLRVESQQGVTTDGFARCWVNDVLVADRQNYQWDKPGFNGMEWYARANSVAVESYYRVGELYLSGKN